MSELLAQQQCGENQTTTFTGIASNRPFFLTLVLKLALDPRVLLHLGMLHIHNYALCFHKIFTRISSGLTLTCVLVDDS